MEVLNMLMLKNLVLNLVINGIPSIPDAKNDAVNSRSVLNLVINGIPSILFKKRMGKREEISFKPCYKWNTFNTVVMLHVAGFPAAVSFKPCYKWNTFNTYMGLWCKSSNMCFKPCYKWNTFNTSIIIYCLCM